MFIDVGRRCIGLKSDIIFLQVLIYTTKVETSHKVIDITQVYEYNELRRKLALLVGTEGWKITYCQSLGDEKFPFGSEL